jgi:hypothetical protein
MTDRENCIVVDSSTRGDVDGSRIGKIPVFGILCGSGCLTFPNPPTARDRRGKNQREKLHGAIPKTKLLLLFALLLSV